MSSEMMRLSSLLETIDIVNDARHLPKDENDKHQFVFVEDDGAFDVDDSSYDYCDDILSMASISICSDLGRDFGIDGSLHDEVPFLADEASTTLKPVQHEILTSVPEFQDNASLGAVSCLERSVSTTSLGTTTMTNPTVHNRDVIVKSRRSNKKRRKALKLMKKAAAMSAAAAALGLTGGTPKSSESPKALPKSPTKKFARNKRVSNVAVACATESLQSFREEVQTRKNSRKKKAFS